MRTASLAIVLISLLMPGCKCPMTSAYCDNGDGSGYGHSAKGGCAGCRWTGWGDYGCAWVLNKEFSKAPPERPGQYGLGDCRPCGALRWCGFCNTIDNDFVADPHVCPGSVPGPAPTVPHQYKFHYGSPDLQTTSVEFSEGYAAGVEAAQQQMLDTIQVQQASTSRGQSARNTGVINASAQSN